MEALSIQLYGELFRSGSLLGFYLLLYSSAVSVLCLFKKKFRPLNISEMEKTSYANIVEALALPALILALTYAVSYTSVLNGFLIWAGTCLAFVLIVKLAGFHILAGVHCLLSGIALVVGVYLVVGTFPA
jgi:hypothetical protein